MQTFWRDLRYGVRVLVESPGFTAIAVLSLALGIGANTALFSVVDAVILKKLTVAEPDRLVIFNWTASREFSPGSYSGSGRTDPATGLNVRTSFPFQSFAKLRSQETVLTELFAFAGIGQVNVNVDGQAEVATAQVVSGNYHSGLGVQPLLGRTITEDDQASASPVAVLTHRYWLTRFGGEPSIVGKEISLNNIAFTIVGVTPRGFYGALQIGASPDFSIPLALEPQVSAGRSNMSGAGVWFLLLMGRLQPGATVEQARASLEAPFQESVVEHRAGIESHRLTQPTATQGRPMPALDPQDYPKLGAISGSRGQMETRTYFEAQLRLLFGVVGLVLLIACANVANLLLSRAAGRQKEIAIRLALGASRWRLTRQLLTESVLMSAIGGIVGVFFALWIKNGLLSVSGWGGARMSALEPRLDLRVLGFTLGLSLLTGVLFGLAPAWRATRVDLTPALKDSAKSSSAASRSLLSKSLVVVQVALSLLLLIGAGLFLRTLRNLQTVETGFNRQNLLVFGVDPGLIGYKGDRLAALYRQMSERIEAVPGVRSVTFSRVTLLSGSISSRGVFLSGATRGADGRVQPTGSTNIHQVRENYFETMEIPLLQGRSLTPKDDERAPRVAVVNRTFAEQFFPNEDPVGRRFSFDPDKPGEVEIVGLCADAKYSSLREEIPPTAYSCWLQELSRVGSATFEVRISGDPTSSIGAIRDAVRDAEGNLPLNNIRTQADQADQSLATEKLFANLLSFFGLLAQQLASIGLYGVMAYSVSQRTREIGIRMALGAQRRDVLGMVVKQGIVLALLGIVLGLAGAYVLTRWLESAERMLYGVRPTDPTTFVVVAVLVLAVAFIACWIPARRAAKVDPMVALRCE
jgi:predicted permease